jgi:hypothetical protein
MLFRMVVRSLTPTTRSLTCERIGVVRLKGLPRFMHPFYHRFVSNRSPRRNCTAAILSVLNTYRDGAT